MRYFIVYYHCHYSSPEPEIDENGHPKQKITFMYDDMLFKTDGFLNKISAKKTIKDRYGLTWVHILGFKEVTQEEAEEYYRGSELI